MGVKKLVSLILVLMLAFAFVSCVKDEDPGFSDKGGNEGTDTDYVELPF